MEVFDITYQIPGSCPICGHEMKISSLTCTHCHTKLEGEFTSCNFCRLDKEQWRFLEIFIKCRGNMKDMEKRLDLSYPTIRNRLEALIQALGFDEEKDTGSGLDAGNRMDILSMLERGEITAREAAAKLKQLDK